MLRSEVVMIAAKVWWWLFIVWSVGEVGILLFTRIRSTGGENKDKGSLRVLWAVILGSLTAGIWYGAVHRHTILGSWVPWVCVGLIAAGLVVRGTAIVRLGRAFSANVAITETQTLETGGLFHWVRHPSYTGMLLIFLSVGLMTRNWVGLALVVVPATCALLYRISVEEDALRGGFGVEYEDYCRVTKRLVPGVY